MSALRLRVQWDVEDRIVLSKKAEQRTKRRTGHATRDCCIELLQLTLDRRITKVVHWRIVPPLHRTSIHTPPQPLGSTAKLASVMETFNATSTGLPDTIHAVIASTQTGILSKAYEHFSSPVGWFGVFLSLFLAAVVYDQSECLLPSYSYSL